VGVARTRARLLVVAWRPTVRKMETVYRSRCCCYYWWLPSSSSSSSPSSSWKRDVLLLLCIQKAVIMADSFTLSLSLRPISFASDPLEEYRVLLSMCLQDLQMHHTGPIVIRLMVLPWRGHSQHTPPPLPPPPSIVWLPRANRGFTTGRGRPILLGSLWVL